MLKKYPRILVAASLACAAHVHAQTAQTAQVTVLRAARLLDVKTGSEITNAVVIIDGARIKQVGTNLQVPSGAKVIDLGNATLLPGFIDVHTHLLQNYEGSLGGDDPNMVLTVAAMGTVRRALLGAAMGREDLEAGITTVRDLGNSGLNGDVALRDAINQGWVVGPRIRASTRALSAAGGQFGGLAPEAQKIIDQEYVVISGVEDARRAVRQAFYDGADLIKVIVNTGPRVVSLEELKVIVDEAHRVGKTVAAHATDDQSTRIAAEAGVNSIEHAYRIPDDVLRIMAEKKIYLVPTDYPAAVYMNLSPANLSPDEMKQREAGIAGFTKGSRDRLARAVKLGVPIAFGSDEYYQFPNSTRGQSSLQAFRAYTESGMTPIQIIRSATVNAADLIGWSDRVGTLEAGKLADIIAVPGDPLQDLTTVENVNFVMKGGKVVKGGSAPAT
jgi:imidazolonepropionase-like amidohydrolase